MMRQLLVMGVITLAAPVHADETCTTTAECGELKCIGAVCRDPKTAREEIATESRAERRKVLFGDEHGYGAQILAADLAAVASVPLIMGLAYAADQSLGHTKLWEPTMLALIPPSVTGPFVHAMHQRWVPAVVSFFGWSSVAVTATGLGWIFAITEGTGCFNCAASDNTTRGWVIGVSIAAGGALLMTALDVFMARAPKPVTIDRASLHVGPFAAPTLGGGAMGIVGTF